MGASRFLYGLALGFGLGIVGSRLLAASSGPQRQVLRKGHARRAGQAAKERRRERVAIR